MMIIITPFLCKCSPDDYIYGDYAGRNVENDKESDSYDNEEKYDDDGDDTF